MLIKILREISFIGDTAKKHTSLHSNQNLAELRKKCTTLLSSVTPQCANTENPINPQRGNAARPDAHKLNFVIIRSLAGEIE